MAARPSSCGAKGSEANAGGAAELVFCVGGIYACFLTWGLLQERIASTDYGTGGKFSSFVLLNLCQSLTCAVYALATLLLSKRGLGPRGGCTLKSYAAVALSASVASPFGYKSLAHINYPTHMLAKSCKLIPVMFMGLVLHRKTYPFYKYVSVAVVTVGVACFMLLLPQKAGGGSENSVFGLSLVLLNMLLDGYTGSTQDELLRSQPISSYQLMFWMNCFSSLFMLLWLVNPWSPALGMQLRSASGSPALLRDISFFCVCGALGQTFIFRSITKFGSVTLVTITVTRKLCTMVLSCLFFGHTITLSQWLCVALVFCGIFYEALARHSVDKSKVA